MPPSLPAALRPSTRGASARAASYWALSRAPRYSLLFALPLLVLYEGLAAALGDLAGVTVRNGADVWLKAPFVALFGPRGPVVFGALVVGASVALVFRDVRRTRDGVRGAVFARMLGESVVLAGLCALLVGVATAQLLRVLSLRVPSLHVPSLHVPSLHVPSLHVPSLSTALAVAGAAPAAAPAGGLAGLGVPAQLMVALGAGLYEELLFRVVLVGAIRAGARRVLGLRPAGANLLAVVLGAVLFSAAHHVGPMGDPLTADRFLFRVVAGLFFSAVFVLRGFGIAAWTHALYDVGVLALGG